MVFFVLFLNDFFKISKESSVADCRGYFYPVVQSLGFVKRGIPHVSQLLIQQPPEEIPPPPPLGTNTDERQIQIDRQDSHERVSHSYTKR